jgi:GrpB-like predicted nucleotidyltransferase (UPF0157 family)
VNLRSIDFPSYQLGMERSFVALAPHSPQWAEAFSEVEKRLLAALPDCGLRLHHIGSTSIAGIQAKPILDIMGVVPSLTVFDSCREKVEAAGFTWKGEYGIEGRRYCVLYSESEASSFAHWHVFERTHPEVATHLLFRDFLRAHADVAREYDLLKTDLRNRLAHERERYTEAKADFIQGVLERARALA